MSSYEQSEGAWEKLSQVAIKGAEYDSSERQPHPMCLEGTRVNLLGHIYGLLEDSEMSRIIWLNGTAGVGKSAVAFTVAERMRGLHVKEQSSSEKRLAGTFFFSRKYTERCTTGYFFATLAYQLASSFPSIRDDLTSAICENSALLDPKKSLRDQMEALFLRPLRRLRLRLLDYPPLVFVIDALDECISEADITLLIFLLGQALRDPGLPVTHILLTSRLESHITEAINVKEVYPLVYEIPVKISGKSLISLDGQDVDGDICIFLEHSFTKLQSRNPHFPRPTEHDLERLASRAGRRFIIASTMMKFIDDGYSDPRDRLQLMLNLRSDILPGTEVYKLYDCIISTCTNPKRALLHLSVVATLANPLPISQISELLGPGQGKDVETVLVQLRSVIDIPADSSLPVSIYHSSIRDYILEPSNCSLFEGEYIIPSPHSLLAYSSFRLMIHHLAKNTDLLNALLKLKMQNQVMESRPPQDLRGSLSFAVEPPTALGVLIPLLWLRGDRSPLLYSWLGTFNGRAWLRTKEGKDWVETQCGLNWLQTQAGFSWLLTRDGKKWLKSPNAKCWLQSPSSWHWLELPSGAKWLRSLSGAEWLRSPSAREWLCGRMWLRSLSGREWLQRPGTLHWLDSLSGEEWLKLSGGNDWLQWLRGRLWLQWLKRREWLQWLRGRGWLQSTSRRQWLRSQSGKEWLQSPSGRGWLQSPSGRRWLQSPNRRDWLQSPTGREWLRLPGGGKWLQSPRGRKWLHSPGRREWLQLPNGKEWLQSPSVREWLQLRSGREWLQTCNGQEWLDTQDAREWLKTSGGQEWLRIPSAREWLHTWGGGDWLQTLDGRVWQLTPVASVWVHTQEFLDTLEAISKLVIISESSLLLAFRIIQQFESLPDFLMFPVFLTLTPTSPTSSELAHDPDMEIIHAINAFLEFANTARERSRSASDALIYACQNWALHLSRASNPCDDTLNHIFKVFWLHHLTSWLERQWCLRGLQSCLIILSEGQKLAKEHLAESLSM